MKYKYNRFLINSLIDNLKNTGSMNEDILCELNNISRHLLEKSDKGEKCGVCKNGWSQFCSAHPTPPVEKSKLPEKIPFRIDGRLDETSEVVLLMIKTINFTIDYLSYLQTQIDKK